MANTYKVISADSHLEIAPDRWTQRVPAQYRDRAPRRIKLPSGGDGVIVEGRDLYVLGLAITGKPPQEHRLEGITYDGGPGAGSPEERLIEQEQDNIDAEVLFTSAGNLRFWRGIRDDAAYRSVVHAYNEFLAEEYCAAAPDRLFAMGCIPITNIDDAVAELEYCTKAGLKGVALQAFPSGKGMPTPEDDRFWAAALDLNMPLTSHIGFDRQGPSFRYKQIPHDVSSGGFGSDPLVHLTFGGSAALNSIQLAFAGVFDRFPRLRIYWAETNIGWLAYFFQHLEDRWNRDRYWMEHYFGVEAPPRPPLEYIKDHCWWGFLTDPLGVEQRHKIGVDKIMWSNDFPHATGDWPNSKDVIEHDFAGVPKHERDKILCSNAVEYFHLGNAR